MVASILAAFLALSGVHIQTADAFILPMSQFQRWSTTVLDSERTPEDITTKSKPEPSELDEIVTRNKVPSRQALEGLGACTSGTQARRLLEKELPYGTTRLYNTVVVPSGASGKGISDGDLAIQTRLTNRKYKIMELIELSGDRDADRASFSVLSVFVSSTISAIVANQNLPGPEIIRFVVVWVLCFAPLVLIGYGIKDAEALQSILVQIQRQAFPAYRQRMIQHEAGHFLMGHLLGWPIQGYTANAVKNAVSFYPLADSDVARDRASQLGFDKPAVRSMREYDTIAMPTTGDVPFFSSEGRGSDAIQRQSVFRDTSRNYTALSQLDSLNEPKNVWPYRGFSDETLDQLTVVSVAGICAELISFGNAEGGCADLNQLRQIMTSSSSGSITEREIDNRIRYALGFTMSVLRRHLGVLDALALAMERDGSVAECVLAIETCTNISGQAGVFGDAGDYERMRRDAFRKNGFSLVEQVFLGSDKNIDVLEDRLVEGKGGGSRKETFRLTGDDPLYLALAVAGVFFLWATAGGLSLH